MATSVTDCHPSPQELAIVVRAAVIVTADLMGLLALFFPQVLVPGYEQYTGLSWAALTQDAPEVAKFFLLALRPVGALNVAVAIPLGRSACSRSENGLSWGGVRGTGCYLAPLNKDKVVPVEQSVEQDVFSDAS